MRVMVIRPGPAFSVADVARGWVNGFTEAGCSVVDLNFDDRLSFYDRTLAAAFPDWKDLTKQDRSLRTVQLATHNIRADIYDFWPDLIVVISGFFIPPAWYDAVRSRGHTVVLVCTESPYEDDRQLLRAPHADVVIVNDPTNLERFKEVNPESYYFPHCYDPKLHYPTDTPRVHDFSFVGTGYPSRIEFFEQVDWSGLDVKLGGYWRALEDDSPLRPFISGDGNECMDNEDTTDLYRASRMSANLYRKEATAESHADGWAMGPREVELAATQTFFLRESRGEGDELFPNLPRFSEPAEFDSLLRYHLARPELCHRLASEAAEAIADRSFVNNARRLLALVE